MAENDNEKYLLNEQVSFIQHFLPGLDAGGYQLNVGQTLTESNDDPISGEDYQASYTFAVKGDRFAFSKPADTVNSVFPADKASGEFTNVLPHVVFTQKTFPWIRYPTNELPYAPPNPGTDTDADVPTWLWVMVLDEDDVAAMAAEDLALDLQPATQKVADLFPPAALPSGVTSSLGDNYSYFQGATDTKGLEPGETLDDAVQTLDVPLKLIWELAPTIADLRQMAHGREVSLINQNTVAQAADPGEPTGTFSIVFSNRLPANQKKSFAFLISLEELEDFLPDQTGGGAPAGNNYDGDKFLRLAVFKAWSFFSTGQPATFVHKLLELNGRPPGDTDPAPITNLRLPYGGDNEVVAGALNMGYVPLNEKLRTAGQTVSWYRGPLVPYNIGESWLQVPLSSPDAATIFDPTTGMLDCSYAAAWTIGRMIALQDTSFSVPYYNWKKDQEQQVMRSVEDDLLDEAVSQHLPASDRAWRMAPGAQEAQVRGSINLLKRTILALNPDK
ncbi:MAG: hypothetical protein AAF998_13670 [Bacteroidota bacterium]